MTPLALAADLEAKHKAMVETRMLEPDHQWAAATLYGAFLDNLPTILASLIAFQSSETVPVQQSGRQTVDEAGQADDRMTPVGLAPPIRKAKIEALEIVIRVPLDALPIVFENACDAHYGEHKLFISDRSEFAKEFVSELNREREDGTTIVHLMLDKAVVNAVESGAFGIDDRALKRDIWK